jgi:hypothetical protein
VGYGSSAFAICIVEVINGELNIAFADEWPRLDFNESIANTERLMAEYDIDRRHGAPVFVDASNPSFIRSLKAGIPGEDVDYERLIDSVKRNVKRPNVVDLQYLVPFMTVIPVPFQKYHKQMLGHTREIIEYGGGCIAYGCRGWQWQSRQGGNQS